MHAMMTLIAMVAALNLQSVAVVNRSHETSLAKGTRIACTLATAVDSESIKSGDAFELDIADANHPELHGAVIDGYVTGVTHPRGLVRARIAFLFSTIRFVNGTREQLRAYVIHESVVPRTESTPRPISASQVAPGMSKQFAPARSTIVFETTLGPKITPTTPTGGYVYATKARSPIVIAKGTRVTIELASALAVP